MCPYRKEVRMIFFIGIPYAGMSVPDPSVFETFSSAEGTHLPGCEPSLRDPSV